MPWVSEHYVRYSREVQSSDAGKPSLLVSFGPNRYENSAGHDEQYDWSCTCEDWRWRRAKDGGYCKHIEHVQGLSPQQGGRSLWKASKIDQPLSIPSKEALDDLEVCLEDPNETLSALSSAAERVITSVQVYTPVTDQDGKLIPAVFLPDIKPVFSKKLADTAVVTLVQKGEPRTGGNLNGTQFGAYLAYQDLQTQQLYDECIRMGFNPNYVFTLAQDTEDNSANCDKCGGYMTRVMSVDPTNDGYFCTNANCSKDINNPSNQNVFYKTTPDTVPVAHSPLLAPVATQSKPKSPPKPGKKR